MSLFISYSRGDTVVVRRLHAALEARGREIWVDWEGIPPSADWMSEIESAIDASDALIFVMSPASLASAVCARELAHAEAQHKRVLPVVVQDAPGVAVPPGLARLNWVFLRDTDDVEAGIDRLLEAVDTDLDWVRAHTRLLIRAHEWEAARANTSLLLRAQDLRSAEQWLALGPTKTPPPTSGQTQLVIASRRHATRQRVVLVSAGGVALAIAAVLGTVALLERRQSERQETLATARRLAAASERVREQAPPAYAEIAPAERSLQLAAESIRRLEALGERSFDADLALRRALQQTLQPLRSVRVPWIGTVLSALVIDDDGRLVATNNSPWAVARWQNADAGWIESRRGGRSYPDSALSPDGRWAVAVLTTGSRPDTLELREVGRDDAALRVMLDESAVSIGVGPGGIVAASVSDDRKGVAETRIWPPGGGQPPAKLPFVHGPTFSADGRWFAGVDDSGVLVWDVAALRASSPGTPQRIALDGAGRLHFSVDSQRLLVSHSEEPERVSSFGAPDWSPSGTVIRQAPLAAGPMTGQWIGGESGASLVQVLQGDRGVQLGSLLRRSDGLVAISPSGRLLAVERTDTVDVWGLHGNGSASFGIAAGADARAIAFGSDGRTLLVVHYGQAGAAPARLVRWTLGDSAATAEQAIGPVPSQAAFSADGRYLVLVQSAAVRVVDTATGLERMRIGPPSVGTPVLAALSPQGDALAVLGGDSSLATWRVASGERVMAAASAASAAPQLAIGDGGAPVTAFHFKGNYRVGARFELVSWTTAAATAPASSALGRQASGFSAQPCALSPDGRLAAINLAGSLAVRNVRSGVEIAVVDEAARPPICALSADGAWLATTGNDATLRVWDLRTRQEAARMELLGEPSSIVFDAASQRIAVLDKSGAVRVWPLALPTMLAQACARMRFTMSRDDWDRFHPGEPYRATCAGLGPAPSPAR